MLKGLQIIGIGWQDCPVCATLTTPMQAGEPNSLEGRMPGISSAERLSLPASYRH